jgi:hypothetical protein
MPMTLIVTREAFSDSTLSVGNVCRYVEMLCIQNVVLHRLPTELASTVAQRLTDRGYIVSTEWGLLDRLRYECSKLQARMNLRNSLSRRKGKPGDT